MYSPSFSSKQSDFNFNHSPVNPLSPGKSSEYDSSLDFSSFDYLFSSNNVASDPTLHKKDQVLLGPGDELIPLPLYKKMFDKSISSDAKSALSFSISFGGFFRYRRKN